MYGSRIRIRVKTHAERISRENYILLNLLPFSCHTYTKPAESRLGQLALSRARISTQGVGIPGFLATRSASQTELKAKQRQDQDQLAIMPTNDVGYDLNLLAMAPAPPNGNRTNPIQYQATQSRRDDLESYQPKFISYTPDAVGSVEPSSSTTKPSPSAEKKPFYRTPKGITIIVIAIIVILAAIIGGAVGGSVRNKKSVQGDQKDSTSNAGSDGAYQTAASEPIRTRTTVTVLPASESIRTRTTVTVLPTS